MEPITNREIEEKYSLATTICLQNNYNKCEKNELLLLIEIFYLNQTKQYDKLVTIFGEQASQGIEINCKKGRCIISIIEDGKGTGKKAHVDATNRLSVRAFTETIQHTISHSEGQAYQIIGTATLTNNYGLYIADQTAGGTDFAIYSAGGTNYFTPHLREGLVERGSVQVFVISTVPS